MIGMKIIIQLLNKDIDTTTTAPFIPNITVTERYINSNCTFHLSRSNLEVPRQWRSSEPKAVSSKVCIRP